MTTRADIGATLDRWALPLGLIGLAVVAGYQTWLAQRDRKMLAERGRPAPLPPPADWPVQPRVSLLVAAWNEAETLDRFIASFAGLRYPNKELVLCAGGPNGEYARAVGLAAGTPGMTVLEQRPGEGKQRALRRCLDRANGAVLFLTDADCVLDDESFERTVFPVATGQERAVSGSHRPYPAALGEPLVLGQAGPRIYSALRSPAYDSGLLGQNAAVERALLVESGGLEAEALTGTDYVLAKMLMRAGARIRQIPDSRVQTYFHTRPGGYIRQQRRWLRNVARHGQRFGARAEAWASLRTSLVGLGMLGLPAAALVAGRLPVVVWLVLLVNAFLARLRYLGVAAAVLGVRVGPREAVLQAPALLLDFVAWSRPLLEPLWPSSREPW